MKANLCHGRKQFYVDATKYLNGHDSANRQAFKRAFFLHPLFNDSQQSMQAICRLTVIMSAISEEEVTDEWKVY